VKLAKSPNLWSRRVAMLATLHTIRKNEFGDTLALATTLLNDPEDLMHKAVGWMLREMGHRNSAPLYAFLDAHAANMPRTMLRYALEKVPAAKRAAYMKAGKVTR
jgi:3-methyladenine DNA glycosylase AlkD